MSQYKETLLDGTVRIVHYNPHNDGPISRRLTLTKRIAWLRKKLKARPAQRTLTKRLFDSLNQLKSISLTTEDKSSRRKSRFQPGARALRTRSRRHSHPQVCTAVNGTQVPEPAKALCPASSGIAPVESPRCGANETRESPDPVGASKGIMSQIVSASAQP